MAGFTIAPVTRTSLDQILSRFVTTMRGSEEFCESLEYAEGKAHALAEFIRPGKSETLKPPNQLVVLRRWNSYTPLLPSETTDRSSKGGGYFIRCGKTGIVIDPGFNFVESFLSAGFKLDDIDHVFISHAHNDHTVELEGLFSLLYKRNTTRKNVTPKRIQLYMNLGALKKFAGYFDLASPAPSSYIGEIVALNRHQHLALGHPLDGDEEASIRVFTTRTRHHEMITSEYALGFTFCFRVSGGKTRVVKFTSDTGWNVEQEEENRRRALSHRLPEQVDVLVAHMGTIKRAERGYDPSKLMTSKRNKRCFYRHHLGILGTVAAAHFWNPSVVLLSEFGEELDGIRVDLANFVGGALGRPVWPTDVNFRLDLDTLRIRCCNTRRFHPQEKVVVRRGKEGQLYALYKPRWSRVDEKDAWKVLGTKIRLF